MKIRVEVSGSNLADMLEWSHDAKVKTAFDLEAGLKTRTPVRTGRARNGWQVVEAGDDVSVENNVEYIEALNNGHSAQAPAGFVEAEIDKINKL